LSRRVFESDPYPSYEAVDLDTGISFLLVRPTEIVEGVNWITGTPVYSFSKRGLEQANDILTRAAEALGEGVVIFIDEFGRLESRRMGIYPGIVKVIQALKRKGVAVILCRGDKVAEVEELVSGSVEKVFIIVAGDPDALLRAIQNHAK